MTDNLTAQQIADRYVAVWNEPDPEVRREEIRAVWAPAGGQLLEPPDDMRKAARAIGFDAPALEARGYEQLETRVTTAYEEFVAGGVYVFRARHDAARLGDVLKFNWEMVPSEGGDVAAAGLDVFVLDADDRIVDDYQFVD
jgi:hypothetical protein